SAAAACARRAYCSRVNRPIIMRIIHNILRPRIASCLCLHHRALTFVALRLMIGGSGAIVSVQDALLKGVHTLLPKLRDFLPSRRDYDIAGIKFDLLAGITVAFVALPLALGF